VPRVYAWSVPVWQADVDAAGEMRASSLLRLLQETATRASAEAGFDPDYYARIGRTWMVRRSTLALAEPARYGDVLTARTWIADFRRVRSRREYEVRVGARPVATAHTDWVLVDARSGQPRRIPTEMEAAFAPEGGAPHPRPPFPHIAPPADAHRSGRRVEMHELDALDHVNNANYAHWIEQAFLDALAARSWPVAALRAAGGRMRPIEHDIEYLSEARYGDAVTAVSWPLAIDEAGVAIATWIMRDPAPRPLLRARSRYAWVPIGVDDPAGAAWPSDLRVVLAPDAS